MFCAQAGSSFAVAPLIEQLAITLNLLKWFYLPKTNLFCAKYCSLFLCDESGPYYVLHITIIFATAWDIHADTEG